MIWLLGDMTTAYHCYYKYLYYFWIMFFIYLFFFCQFKKKKKFVSSGKAVSKSKSCIKLRAAFSSSSSFLVWWMVLLIVIFRLWLFIFFLFPGHRTPPARSGHRCVADNTNLYVFGGYNPDYDESGGSENEDYPLFRELWRYHFATGCWQQIRTEGYMPTELASMSGEALCI